MLLPNIVRVPSGEGCRRCACHTYLQGKDGFPDICAACGTPRGNAVSESVSHIVLETEFAHLRCDGCGVGWCVATEPVPLGEFLLKVDTFRGEHAKCSETMRGGR